MSAGRWLARDRSEFREGSTTPGLPAEEVIQPLYSGPSRYPIMWRLSIESLAALAASAGETVSELIERAACRSLV